MFDTFPSRNIFGPHTEIGDGVLRGAGAARHSVVASPRDYMCILMNTIMGLAAGSTAAIRCQEEQASGFR